MNYPDGMRHDRLDGDPVYDAPDAWEKAEATEQAIRDEYAHAIAFAGCIETLAVIADAYAAAPAPPKLPEAEIYRHTIPDTWADVASNLRNVAVIMGATDKQVEEMADIRITGEGYA